MPMPIVAPPLIWLIAVSGFTNAAAVVDREVLQHLDAPELDVDLDFHEVRAERAADLPLHRRARSRRSNQYVAILRQSFVRDLLLEIPGRLDDGVTGHDRRAAAGFADGVRAAIRIAPDDIHARQRHAEGFGGDHPHRRLRARADVSDADVHGIAALPVEPDDRAAASKAGAKRHERNAGA